MVSKPYEAVFVEDVAEVKELFAAGDCPNGRGKNGEMPSMPPSLWTKRASRTSTTNCRMPDTTPADSTRLHSGF